MLKEILRPFKRGINTIIHSGNNVTCNCCNHSFKSFRHLGYGANNVGACWYCNSYPRVRMLKDYLEQTFNQNIKNSKILHIAPEKQIYDWLRCNPDVSYIAGDKRTKGYKYPDDVIDLDITQLPFEDNTFDVVICNHVLEHVKNDTKAIKEIYRVLRHNGIAIPLIPIDKSLEETIEEPDGISYTAEERLKHFGQFDHVRLYGLDYYAKLKSNGFNVNIITPSNEKISKLGLYSEEDIILCIKL